MKTFTSVLLAGCLFSPVAMADSCRYSRDINFDVVIAGLERLDIDLGAGSLGVRGAPDADEVSVRATACADSQDLLDEMDLKQTRRGDTLEISSEINRSAGGFSFFGMRYAYIDVDISIPAGLTIEIEDGSGDIAIEDVSGNFKLDDGSGDISVRNLVGNIEVADGSGNIVLDSIRGTVHIPEDGSGSIRVQTVEGDVTIDDDGSGNIEVYDVTGDFIARDTGSGDVDYSDIGGRVDVRD